jgi:hypothetical protein
MWSHSQWRKPLELLLDSWEEAPKYNPRFADLAAEALLRDSQTLLSTCPLGCLSFGGSAQAAHWALLRNALLDTKAFLTDSVLPSCQSRQREKFVTKKRRLATIAPYSGGSSMSSGAPPVMRNTTESLFRFGCLNPGPCGLSQLQSPELLWWRLWEIGRAAQDLKLILLVLPGPRLPEGAELPSGFPYLYVGARGQDWATVGLLLDRSFAKNVVVLTDLSICPRRIWLVLSGTSNSRWLICCFYAPPNGDVDFYTDLVAEAKQSIREHNAITGVLLVGDGNVHLSSCVSHGHSCQCLHCRQTPADRQIEALLLNAGLHCCNPTGMPTHKSGSVIDLVLSTLPSALRDVVVHPVGHVGMSDHSLVTAALDFTLARCSTDGFGRVSWTSGLEWQASLSVLDYSMQSLASLVSTFMRDPVLQNATATRTQIRLRRRIVDAFVWLRDVWCTMAGRLGGSVKVTPPSSGCGAVMSETQAWEQQRERWAKYLALRSEEPQLASKLLAKMLRPKVPVEIQLRHEKSGRPLTAVETVEVLVDDIVQRPTLAVPVGSHGSKKHARLVSAVRQGHALVDPLSEQYVVDDDPLFSMGELESVLATLCPRRFSFRGCYAAVKAPCPGSRLLTLALHNLCYCFCLTATEWAARQYNPL